MFKSIISSAIVLSLILVQHVSLAQKGSVGINAGVTFDPERTPLAASAEYFISDAFSLGIQGYHSWQVIDDQYTFLGTTYSTYSKFTSTFIGLRTNLHLSYFLPDDYQRFDPFVGLSVGKILVTGKQNNNLGVFGQSASEGNRSYDGLTVYMPIGLRYLITDHIGAFVEYNVGLTNTTADVDQNGKIEKFYEKRQYNFGAGFSLRF